MDGVYSGGNVSVSSADGYKTEFLGIAGDHHSVAAAVNITKADGSDFVDPDNVEFTYILNRPYGIVGQKYEDEVMDKFNAELQKFGTNVIEYYHQRDLGRNTVLVDQSLWNRMLHGFKRTSDVNTVQYFLTSPDTIKCVMRFDDGSYDLVGQKMNFEGGVLFLYNVRDILASCTIKEGYDAECLLEYGETEYFSKNKEIVDSIADNIKAARKTLGEDEYIVKYINNDGKENKLYYYVAQIKMEFIAMKGSCRLNYKPSSHKTFEVKENSYIPIIDGYEDYQGHKFSDVTGEIVSIDAGTFNGNVRLECTGDTSPFYFEKTKGCPDNKWYDHLKLYIIRNPFEITLDSGKKVYGKLELGSWTVNGDGSVDFMITYYTDTDWISIAPEEIASVTLDGQRIV